MSKKLQKVRGRRDFVPYIDTERNKHNKQQQNIKNKNKKIIPTGNLKMEDKKMMEKMNEKELNNVAGGQSNGDYYHDLSNFVTKQVCNVVHYDSTSCLTLRREANGSIIYGYGWQNGDTILVHKDYTDRGWLFAYQNGKYGFVNPNYVK